MLPPQGIPRLVHQEKTCSLSSPLVRSGINIDSYIFLYIYIKVVSGLNAWVVFGSFLGRFLRSGFPPERPSFSIGQTGTLSPAFVFDAAPAAHLR